MRQLTALDAQFLNIESTTTVGHVGGLSILDPSTAPDGVVTVDDVRALIERRLHLAAPLRWRLVEVPLGLDHPYWIEDPEFDLEYHVREIALPAPGSDEQLAEQVARLAARPLDRRRPLWELYLIHGLAGARAALYGKVHHAAIDGVSGAEILGVLMDPTPNPRPVPPPDSDWRPEPVPAPLNLLRSGLVRLAAHPVRTLRAVPKTLPHLAEITGGAQAPGAELVSRVSGTLTRLTRLGPGRTTAGVQKLSVPETPFNGPITPHRRFAFGSVPLEDVKLIKDAFGITVNDVVMALCAGLLRRWLIDHDALPEIPLVAGVPISVRTPEQAGSAGNQVSVMLAPLATHLEDPGERLAAVAGSMATAKSRYHALPATWLQEFSAMLPAALGGLAARALFRYVSATRPPFNLFISNVPGPQHTLYQAGAKMTGNYPVSAISDASGGINITVMSYAGSVDFGIIVCREMVPDVWNMIDYLHEAVDELKILAEKELASR